MLKRKIGLIISRTLRALVIEPPRNLDPKTNGEYALLRFLAAMKGATGQDTIVDIGASVGDWTEAAMRSFSETDIKYFICVEPIPALAAGLRERFAGRHQVQIVEAAASAESNPTISMYNAGGGGRIYWTYKSAAESAPRPKKKSVERIEVKAISGKDLLAGRSPYLIKIDCEGHDLHIIQGLLPVLKTARPFVQFEYSEYWIGARSSLRQAAKLFTALDYRIYRVFPKRLVPARVLIDTYEYQNIVAAPAEHAEALDAAFASAQSLRND